MIFKIKIMSEGDRVLNCWDDKIAISRKNGEVDIFQIAIGENDLPTLSEDIWRITHGNNTIEITNKDTKSKSQKNKTSVPSNNSQPSSSPGEDDDFVIMIRPKKGR